jgi:hypothetical protein
VFVGVFIKCGDGHSRGQGDFAAGVVRSPVPVGQAEDLAEEAIEVGPDASHRRIVSLGPPNTEISCEDRAILALAGFVSFISLLCGCPRCSYELHGGYRARVRTQANHGSLGPLVSSLIGAIGAHCRSPS